MTLHASLAGAAGEPLPAAFVWFEKAKSATASPIKSLRRGIKLKYLEKTMDAANNLIGSIGYHIPLIKPSLLLSFKFVSLPNANAIIYIFMISHNLGVYLRSTEKKMKRFH